jgi:hypothetical protein
VAPGGVQRHRGRCVSHALPRCLVARNTGTQRPSALTWKSRPQKFCTGPRMFWYVAALPRDLTMGSVTYRAPVVGVWGMDGV